MFADGHPDFDRPAVPAISSPAACDSVAPPGGDGPPPVDSGALLAHLPALRRFLAAMRCPPGELDDLSQESVAQYWAARHRVYAGPALRPFLFGIAVNVLRAYRRRARVADAHLRAYRVAPAAGGSGAWCGFVVADAGEDARVAVRWLTAAQRQAVSLFYFDGLSAGAAAAEVGCSPAEMRRRLSGAYKVLRRRLCPGVKGGGPPNGPQNNFSNPHHSPALSRHYLVGSPTRVPPANTREQARRVSQAHP